MQMDIDQYAKQVLDAVHHSNWRIVAALVLVGLVGLLRKYGPMLVKSDRGGALLALGLGVFGGLSTALMAHTLTLNALVDGVLTGVTAAGGYTMVKRILKPVDKAPDVAPPVPPPAQAVL